jgi:hypothetical protein
MAMRSWRRGRGTIARNIEEVKWAIRSNVSCPPPAETSRSEKRFDGILWSSGDVCCPPSSDLIGEMEGRRWRGRRSGGE